MEAFPILKQVDTCICHESVLVLHKELFSSIKKHKGEEIVTYL